MPLVVYDHDTYRLHVSRHSYRAREERQAHLDPHWRGLTARAWQGRLTMLNLQALSPLKWQHVNPYGTGMLHMQARQSLKQVREAPQAPHHVAPHAGMALALGEHLVGEHLDQSLGPRRRGNLPGENLLRGHAAAVIFGIRVITCANHRPFQRDPSKQALAPAVRIDSGDWRDPNFSVPPEGPGSYTNIAAQREVHVVREGLHSSISVEDQHQFCHLRTNLQTKACPTRANS